MDTHWYALRLIDGFALMYACCPKFRVTTAKMKVACGESGSFGQSWEIPVANAGRLLS